LDEKAMESIKEKKVHPRNFSNDALDAIAACVLIIVTVMAIVFWLSDMPY
jgi:hypothetical protein